MAARRKSWMPNIFSTSKDVPDVDGNGAHPTAVGDQTPMASPHAEDFDPATPTSLSRSSSWNLSRRSSTSKRWSTSNTQSPPSQQQQQQQQQPDPQQLMHALERTSTASSAKQDSRNTGSFGRMSLSGFMGGLSLSRQSTNQSTAGDEPRGRTTSKIMSRARSSSHAPPDSDPPSRSQSRARSQSPFSFRRFRHRDPSPEPQRLPLSTSETDVSEAGSTSHANIRPRTAYDDDSDAELAGEFEGGAETDEEEWTDDDVFDPITERNTERNALIEPALDGQVGGAPDPDDGDPDPLGEGVNVVVPPEPYFPSTLNPSSIQQRGSRRGGPKRRKSMKYHEPLSLQTSRPIFKRDRCIITLTQGDPSSMRDEGRPPRRYIVASDLSEESRFAVEWGIGTVLRDGDEMLIVTVMENENKVDPAIPNPSDRSHKLRNQQERQGMAYILVRQATSLLQRTSLNVGVTCQAWHAKHARHMLLDIVDYFEPIMLIVGSRGLSHLKGILLGSTSHYLIQKCSVPVMVARRRLKRPPRRSAHLSKNRQHVKLSEAGIDSVASKVEEDVKVMRDEMQRERDSEREPMGAAGSKTPRGEGIEEGFEEEEKSDEDGDGDVGENTGASPTTKVAGDS